MEQSKSIDGRLAFYPTAGPEANLDPKFAAVLEQLLSVCRSKGYNFRLSYGLRTPQKQAEYYCQWVKHPPALIDTKANMLRQKGAPWLASVLLGFRDTKRTKNWVTGQLPGSGWHQWGLSCRARGLRNDRFFGASKKNRGLCKVGGSLDTTWKFCSIATAAVGFTQFVGEFYLWLRSLQFMAPSRKVPRKAVSGGKRAPCSSGMFGITLRQKTDC